ncbi:DUF3305 domain-containing protein [Hydrogenophaga sp.]|uniref:DUF3305 domain-containing protein n=1 Tax=Hydrogenophaga sp. TaxID=1904254 RepID=UPI0025BF9744|nr:DUF3305 domain-containing protein [Hydrogenophaga sp.]
MDIDPSPSTLRSGRPVLDVDVVMRREPVVGPMARWQPWRWVLSDVLLTGEPAWSGADAEAPPAETREVSPLEGTAAVAGASYWLYPGRRVTLFRDDAEGYFLNLSSPKPCFWVFWRLDEARLIDGEPVAVPQVVTLSYHDAGRWLDAQERVDQVAAPAPVVDWLRGFVAEHYQAEPKRRKRPDSFKPLTDRFGQPVRISTEKVHGPRPPGSGA